VLALVTAVVDAGGAGQLTSAHAGSPPPAALFVITGIAAVGALVRTERLRAPRGGHRAGY